MADDLRPRTICANSDCRVVETGKCVEGLELTACPHYGRPSDEATEIVNRNDELREATSVVLQSADTLTPAQGSSLLRAGNARVIAIIGPSDAGKTSLIASLYDLFQEGPVSGMEYARSSTLHAFEQACHDARAASRRGVPHINRTPHGEVRFYHLDLGGGQAGDRLALALGDRAGEEYRGAADDVSVVSAFPEIKRADSITMLVDGRRLLDSGARHNLRSETIMMLQALVDGGTVQPSQRLALVLTKIDEVQASPNQRRAEVDFVSLLDNVQVIFGAFFAEIRHFRIAASPRTDEVRRGTGVHDLLSFWIEPTNPAPTKVPAKPIYSRAFAALLPLGC